MFFFLGIWKVISIFNFTCPCPSGSFCYITFECFFFIFCHICKEHRLLILLAFLYFPSISILYHKIVVFHFQSPLLHPVYYVCNCFSSCLFCLLLLLICSFLFIILFFFCNMSAYLSSHSVYLQISS